MPIELRVIQQAFKYALDPTPSEARMLASHAGASRYAFNWGCARFESLMGAWIEERKAGAQEPTVEWPNHFALCKAWTAYKDDPESGVPWVGQNSSGTYQAALRDAATAWKNYLDSLKGRRKGKRVGRPRFKARRRTKPSFQVHGSALRLGQGVKAIQLPTIGLVRTYEKTKKLRRLLARPETACPPCKATGLVPAIKNGAVTYDDSGALKTKNCPTCKGARKVPYARLVRASVSQEPSGRWYVSLTVERIREIRTGPSRRQRAGGVVGADFGVRDLVTLSSGQVIANPRHLAGSSAKLRRAQQALSRATDGSARRERARLRVAKLHRRVAALRLDGLHKATSDLIHNHSVIVVEGWSVQDTMSSPMEGMPRRVRRNRNRALADAATFTARWQLESKGDWYGARVVKTGPHDPTGRTCSACGEARTKPIPPAEELFRCPSCGHVSDRRLNTARALARAHDAPSGGESQNARGGRVRPGAPRRDGRPPVKREASIRSPRDRDQTGTPDP